MKVLHLEENHPALVEGLQAFGFQNDLGYNDSFEEIMDKIDQYEGLINRSKYPINETFLKNHTKLYDIRHHAADSKNYYQRTACSCRW